MKAAHSRKLSCHVFVALNAWRYTKGVVGLTNCGIYTEGMAAAEAVDESVDEIASVEFCFEVALRLLQSP